MRQAGVGVGGSRRGRRSAAVGVQLGELFTKALSGQSAAPAPQPIGWVIRVTNGTRITRHYVDPTQPPSDELHRFESERACSKFVKRRKALCKSEGRPSVFDVHRYRFEPVYARGRDAR